VSRIATGARYPDATRDDATGHRPGRPVKRTVDRGPCTDPGERADRLILPTPGRGR